MWLASLNIKEWETLYENQFYWNKNVCFCNDISHNISKRSKTQHDMKVGLFIWIGTIVLSQLLSLLLVKFVHFIMPDNFTW